MQDSKIEQQEEWISATDAGFRFSEEYKKEHVVKAIRWLSAPSEEQKKEQSYKIRRKGPYTNKGNRRANRKNSREYKIDGEEITIPFSLFAVGNKIFMKASSKHPGFLPAGESFFSDAGTFKNVTMAYEVKPDPDRAGEFLVRRDIVLCISKVKFINLEEAKAEAKKLHEEQKLFAIAHDLPVDSLPPPQIRTTTSSSSGNVQYKIVMQLPYLKGENAWKVLFEKKPPPSLLQRFEIIIAVLKEMQRMHAKGIVHRDIKLENFMYDEKTKTAKIIDMGLAEQKTSVLSNQSSGSHHYFDPRILPDFSRKYHKYTLATDLYAASQMLFYAFVDVSNKEKMDNLDKERKFFVNYPFVPKFVWKNEKIYEKRGLFFNPDLIDEEASGIVDLIHRLATCDLDNPMLAHKAAVEIISSLEASWEAVARSEGADETEIDQRKQAWARESARTAQIAQEQKEDEIKRTQEEIKRKEEESKREEAKKQEERIKTERKTEEVAMPGEVWKLATDANFPFNDQYKEANIVAALDFLKERKDVHKIKRGRYTIDGQKVRFPLSLIRVGEKFFLMASDKTGFRIKEEKALLGRGGFKRVKLGWEVKVVGDKLAVREDIALGVIDVLTEQVTNRPGVFSDFEGAQDELEWLKEWAKIQAQTSPNHPQWFFRIEKITKYNGGTEYQIVQTQVVAGDLKCAEEQVARLKHEQKLFEIVHDLPRGSLPPPQIRATKSPKKGGIKYKIVIQQPRFKGKNAQTFFDDKSLSVAKRFEVIIAVLEEIQRMHAKNIVHRDIKLENFIYDEDTKTAKVIDLAFATEGRVIEQVNLGSFRYADPRIKEPGAGWFQYTQETDLYAASQMLFYAFVEIDSSLKIRMKEFKKNPHLPKFVGNQEYYEQEWIQFHQALGDDQKRIIEGIQVLAYCDLNNSKQSNAALQKTIASLREGLKNQEVPLSEEERQRRAEEEGQRRAEEERQRLAAEARLRLAEEARLRLAEEARLRLAEEARLRLAEEARLRLAEEERQRRAVEQLAEQEGQQRAEEQRAEEQRAEEQRAEQERLQEAKEEALNIIIFTATELIGVVPLYALIFLPVITDAGIAVAATEATTHICTALAITASVLTIALGILGIVNILLITCLWYQGYKTHAASVAALTLVGAVVVLLAASSFVGWIIMGVALLIAVASLLHMAYKAHYPSAPLNAPAVGGTSVDVANNSSGRTLTQS